MIKSATHGTDVNKEFMINRIKTIYYNTVAFNASAVAIGYTIFSTMLAVMRLPGTRAVKTTF